MHGDMLQILGTILQDCLGLKLNINCREVYV